MDVGIAFFLLGIFAALVRTDIQFPKALYQTLILYLLLAIGLISLAGWRAYTASPNAAAATPDVAAAPLPTPESTSQRDVPPVPEDIP